MEKHSRSEAERFAKAGTRHLDVTFDNILLHAEKLGWPWCSAVRDVFDAWPAPDIDIGTPLKLACREAWETLDSGAHHK